jgi:hypothetical protein
MAHPGYDTKVVGCGLTGPLPLVGTLSEAIEEVLLDRVPVWILGCLVYAPALLVIGLISRQPPIFIAIGLIVLAPVGFYIARKMLRDFELPFNAPLSDLIVAIKKKQSAA